MLGNYATEPLEPAFALASQKGLRLGSQFETRAAWRHLSAMLVRDPRDLRSHAQRIYLALDSEDPELAFGALTDLFIALGEKGLNLRSALLELSRPYLAGEHYFYLQAHLDHGLDPNIALPAPQGSLFDRGLAGTLRLLEKQRTEAMESPRDALAEAVSLLDDGQVDQARTLLEEALVNDPGNAQVEAHLLEIYRRSQNEAAFLKMRERLGRTGARLSDVWEKSEAA
jgi:hypothetical protein